MKRVQALALAAVAVLLIVVACKLPDTAPPTVSITYPAHGAPLAKDTIRIKAYATDNVGVTRVEFSVDGSLLDTRTSGSDDTFSYLWDATSAAAGGHGLVATAYDAANNHSRDSVYVTIQSSDTVLPTVTITYPANGETLSKGAIAVKAHATDNVGITKVVFKVDTTTIATVTSGANDTFTTSWDAGSAASGGHAITAKAYDAANNTKQDSIYVTLTGGGGAGTHHAGEISASETWYRAGNPHFIDDDVYVDNNATLTIQPGCTVKFTSGTQLYCGDASAGAIVAVGKTDSTILFTSNATSPAPGDWSRISFYDNTMPATRFLYCTIEYGGPPGSGRGELYVSGCRAARVDGCKIWKSGDDGIVCATSGSSFTSWTSDTITACALYPIDVWPNDVKDIGAGNVLTGNTSNAIYVEGGIRTNAIVSNGTWRNLGVPYILSGDVEVAAPTGPVLTIEAGDTIKLASGVELYCGNTNPGAIAAVGTVTSPIIFTSAVPSSQFGDWRDIGLYSGTTNATRFVYCNFTYGGEAGSGHGEIYIEGNTNATMDHCDIRYSADYGIACGTNGSCFKTLTNTYIGYNLSYPIDIWPNDIRHLDTTDVVQFNNGHNGVWVEEGNGSNAITTSETWPLVRTMDGYELSGDIEVAGPTGPTLTLKPGTTVMMANDVELYCGYTDAGAINAVGTPTAPIKFTSILASPSPGSWKDVGFYDGSTNRCSLAYCTIKYGGSESSFDGDVHIENTILPVVQHDSIENSAGFGIYLDGLSYPDTSLLRSTNTFINDPSGDIHIP
ncbi:MAG TPA: Ig-like domain-containing protein [bacterium]|nr:Ig-like domain-containing protein [bacterium]